MSVVSRLFVIGADAALAEAVRFGFERDGARVTVADRAESLAALLDTTGEAGGADDGRPQLVVASADSTERGRALLAQVTAALVEHEAHIPVLYVAGGHSGHAAVTEGASQVLVQPAFVRDVVTLGKLLAGARPEDPGAVTGSLAEYGGVFYLLRAMAAVRRTGVLILVRGLRRGELRFYEGEVTSAQVGMLHGQAALHQLLLWTDAEFQLYEEPVVRRRQIPLSPEELIADAERFLSEIRLATGSLSMAGVYEQNVDVLARTARLIPAAVHGVIRLMDGHRTVADVIEDSPFRVFETLRIVHRLVDSKVIRRVEPRADDSGGLAVERWLLGANLPGVPVPISDDDSNGERESSSGQAWFAGLPGSGTGSGRTRKERSGRRKRKRKREISKPSARLGEPAADDGDAIPIEVTDWSEVLPASVSAEPGFSPVVPSTVVAGEIVVGEARARVARTGEDRESGGVVVGEAGPEGGQGRADRAGGPEARSRVIRSGERLAVTDGGRSGHAEPIAEAPTVPLAVHPGAEAGAASGEAAWPADARAGGAAEAGPDADGSHRDARAGSEGGAAARGEVSASEGERASAGGQAAAAAADGNADAAGAEAGVSAASGAADARGDAGQTSGTSESSATSEPSGTSGAGAQPREGLEVVTDAEQRAALFPAEPADASEADRRDQSLSGALSGALSRSLSRDREASPRLLAAAEEAERAAAEARQIARRALEDLRERERAAEAARAEAERAQADAEAQRVTAERARTEVDVLGVVADEAEDELQRRIEALKLAEDEAGRHTQAAERARAEAESFAEAEVRARDHARAAAEAASAAEIEAETRAAMARQAEAHAEAVRDEIDELRRKLDALERELAEVEVHVRAAAAEAARARELAIAASQEQRRAEVALTTGAAVRADADRKSGREAETAARSREAAEAARAAHEEAVRQAEAARAAHRDAEVGLRESERARALAEERADVAAREAHHASRAVEAAEAKAGGLEAMAGVAAAGAEPGPEPGPESDAGAVRPADRGAGAVDGGEGVRQPDTGARGAGGRADGGSGPVRSGVDAGGGVSADAGGGVSADAGGGVSAEGGGGAGVDGEAPASGDGEPAVPEPAPATRSGSAIPLGIKDHPFADSSSGAARAALVAFTADEEGFFDDGERGADASPAQDREERERGDEPRGFWQRLFNRNGKPSGGGDARRAASGQPAASAEEGAGAEAGPGPGAGADAGDSEPASSGDGPASTDDSPGRRKR